MTRINTRNDVVDIVHIRVARGVSALNDYYVDEPWYNEIDTSGLVMQETCNCVLGQLGGFIRMVDALDLSNIDVVTHGFDFDDIDDDGYDIEDHLPSDEDDFGKMYWEELQRAWLLYLS